MDGIFSIEVILQLIRKRIPTKSQLLPNRAYLDANRHSITIVKNERKTLTVTARY